MVSGRTIGWVLMVVTLLAGGIAQIGGTDLGLPHVAVAWITLLGTITGTLQAFAPQVHKDTPA